MEHQLLTAIVEETSKRLAGRYLGKIFQLSKLSIAFDFGIRGTFLLVGVDARSPRYYLIDRRPKDLEKQSIQPSAFAQGLRARLAGASLLSIVKDSGDRIVRLQFNVDDVIEGNRTASLVVQLTGRTANVLLLDDSDLIVDVFRITKDPGQRPGDLYHPPARATRDVASDSDTVLVNESPSAQADAQFRRLDEHAAFTALANRLRTKARTEIAKQKKLKSNLERDLERHGHPETHKRIGDLLLANVGTAVRKAETVMLTDYFAEGTPMIEVELDANTSIQDGAANQYRLYAKAKRAKETTAARLVEIDDKIQELEKRERAIEQMIQQSDYDALINLDDSPSRHPSAKARQQKPVRVPGVRRYLSSDGYEVWVGRTARDNDNLTFHLARPNDMWFHAADYPGSHVIIRKPARKEIPQRTLIEAAQLAARFSQASEDTRVVVHYSERKFLSKPKGAAPGLVRMSRVRSITVEPREVIERIPQ